MGHERRHAGKYLYVCTALLTVLASCAHDPGSEAGRQRLTASGSREHLQRVKQNLDRKDFEGAVREYQQALAAPDRSGRADLMLFDLGLIHAHPDNPARDYRKSLACFTRLLKEHPKSPLGTEARIWADVLETLERAKQVDLELDEKQKLLNR